MSSLFVYPRTSNAHTFCGEAQEKLHSLDSSTSKIYIFELFAGVAAIYNLRDELWCRKVLLFVDNEAPCAALTKGAANNWIAWMLVYTLRAVAARCDAAL